MSYADVAATGRQSQLHSDLNVSNRQEIDRQRTTRASFQHHLVELVNISTLERALNSAHGDGRDPS